MFCRLQVRGQHGWVRISAFKFLGGHKHSVSSEIIAIILGRNGMRLVAVEGGWKEAEAT